MNISDRLKEIEARLAEIWKLLMPIRAGGGGGAHNILSGTHTDSTAAAAVRGDLIAADSNPKWKRLAKGSSGQVLQCDANDVKWDAVPAHASRHQSGGADAIKLDDLSAPDNNTDLNASNAAHGLLLKGENDTEKFLRSDISWQKITGSGSNVLNLWCVEAFESSPQAESDHFDDASIDAKWTAFHSHAALTVTEAENFLKMIDTGNGAATHNIRGYFQPLPGGFGDYTITCRMAFIPDMSAEQGAWLMLFEDATNNPNTCNLYGVGSYCATTTAYVLVSSFAQWDTFTTNPYQASAPIGWPAYYRIRRSGTTLYFAFSRDGLNWYRCGTVTEAALGWSPAEFGLVIDNRTAANTLKVWWDFVHYKASNDTDPQGEEVEFWVT